MVQRSEHFAAASDLGLIALLTVLFRRLGLGLQVFCFPSDQVLHLHLLSCPGISLLLHSVLVKFQQSISGVGGGQAVFCVGKEGLS